MLAIVCPGQGSQTPGFLAPWMELPGFTERMNWLGAVAGLDLVAHGTTSDEATIKDTAVAQPLIVGSGLVSLLALFAHPADGFRAVAAGAGHSVGEITAASAAGVISAEQAMVFVRLRGQAMAKASAATPTGMSAVMGGDADEVRAAIEALGLTPANANGSGQIVAAGDLESLAQLAANPPAKSRVIPLKVAGAFHTDYMAPARTELAGYAAAISTHDARTRLISNADGEVVHSGRQVLSRLVSQVSSPVRWDLCMQTMLDLGITGMIEIPPAGTLTSLAKRGMPGVETLALKSPDQIDAALRMIAEHGGENVDGGASAAYESPAWRMVVTPLKGTVALAGAEVGDIVKAGDVVAQVKTLRETHPVTATHDGRLVEWLVEDGDPVAPGQPIVRLYPA